MKQAKLFESTSHYKTMRERAFESNLGCNATLIGFKRKRTTICGGGCRMKQREYKFRAWDTKYKCMFIPKKIDFYNFTLQMEEGCIWDSWDPDGNEQVILMQYAGMRDHRGIEIYEGDIVSMEAMTPGAPSIVGEVQFEESCYWVVNEKQEKGVRLFQEGVYIEKLGNIFENLELLKEFRDETKA